jgi:hypothetical protein
MRYCGRDFTPAEIDLIRDLLTTPQINRARLSREVCDRLQWRSNNAPLMSAMRLLGATAWASWAGRGESWTPYPFVNNALARRCPADEIGR